MSELQTKKLNKTNKHKKYFWLKTVFITALILIYGIVCCALPLPQVYPQAISVQSKAETATSLKWPKKGQSAIGALGYGVLDTNGGDKPMPTASIAKVLTALAVLKQKPLLKGQQGPIITITSEDVATYQKYADSNGSLVPVQEGEELTEYQALQALLLPSANNIADLLVKWAFGSEPNYVTFSNSIVKSLGLEHTTVADASGFSPKTVSTARDLVLLGENVMDNPVLAEIVGQSQAIIPVAGVINNVNLLLGHNEIIGIKTGNTDEAGGCFLFASKHVAADGQNIIVIGVTLGANDLSTAIDNSLVLLKSAYPNFVEAKAVSKGEVVGRYVSPWGGETKVAAASDVKGISWKSTPPNATIELKPIKSNKATLDGEVLSTFGRKRVSSTLILEAPLSKAPLLWRISHPLQIIKYNFSKK